jgi:membrane protease YdiL (CAAX protease family)
MEESVGKVSYGFGGVIKSLFLVVILFNVSYLLLKYVFDYFYGYDYTLWVSETGFDVLSGYLKSFSIIFGVYVIVSSDSRAWFDELAIKPIGIKTLLLCIAPLFFYFIFCDSLWLIFDGTEMQRYIVADRKIVLDSSTFFAAFLSTVVLAPIAEEILFRGYIFNCFVNESFGNLLSGFLSTVIFVAAHYYYDAFFLVEVFVISLIISFARIKTKSIVPCVVIHCIYNSVFFF